VIATNFLGNSTDNGAAIYSNSGLAFLAGSISYTALILLGYFFLKKVEVLKNHFAPSFLLINIIFSIILIFCLKLATQ
jgi:hypothetical protein